MTSHALSFWRACSAVGRSDATSFVSWAHKSWYSLGTSVIDYLKKYNAHFAKYKS